MTHATKAIYKLLLTDYVKVSKVSVEDMLFDEQDINKSMDKIEVGTTSYYSFSLLLFSQLFCIGNDVSVTCMMYEQDTVRTFSLCGYSLLTNKTLNYMIMFILKSLYLAKL